MSRTILVVDDQKVIREVLKVYLASSRASMLEAADGEQALEVMRKERPDLVIADMQMPRLDGLQLCLHARADPQLRDIPVVILTGAADTKMTDACRQAGAKEILKKPVTPQALLAAIERACPAPV